MLLNVDRVLAARAQLDVVMTRPLLSTNAQHAANNERWAQYARSASSLFELSSLSDCDFAVLPYPWQLALEDEGFMRAAHEISREAQEAGKELIVFYQLDDESVRIDLPSALVSRRRC